MSGPADLAIVRLGLRVRDLRLDLDWSQEHLAELADMHRNYVGKVERAELNPSFGKVVRLATALGTTVCGLYPDNGSPFTPEHSITRQRR